MKVVKKSRNSNIEILRIIAILMIIFSHYSVHCASEYLTTFSFNKIFCETLELGNLGVIIFILIFGYYYDTNKLRLNKFLNLVIPVIFYSVVLYLCFNKLDYHIIPCFFPVLFRRYWYVTAYIVLYLFSPYLSKFIESLTRSNFKKFLITIFLVWQIIPWAFSFIGQTAMYSSAFTDILPIYFLGAYLKKYPNNIFNKYKKYLKYVLLISFLIIILAVIGITLLSSRFIILKMNTNQFLLRTSPFVTIIAGALLMIFKNKKERTNKIINKIAGLSYGIYLIHYNTNFSYFLWYKLLKVPLYVKTNLLIPHMFISCLLVYLACGLIEFLREFLHEKLLAKRLYNLSIKIETKFKKLKFIN